MKIKHAAWFAGGAVFGAVLLQSCSFMERGRDRMSTLLWASLSRVDIELAHDRHVVLTDGPSLRFLKAALAMTQVRTSGDLARAREAGRAPITWGYRPVTFFFSDGATFTCYLEAYAEHRGLRIDVLWCDLDLDATMYDVEFPCPPPPPLAKLLEEVIADKG
jgi:hypothetical protein